MTVPAIAPITAQIAPISGIEGLDQTAGAAGVSAPSATDGADFAASLTDAVRSVESTEKTADTMVNKLAAGEQVELSEVMAATTEAQLSMQTFTAVRDRAVDAYTQFMNLQV